MKKRLMGKKLLVLAVAGALLVLAAGVSYAAIPGADGKITACYDKQSGQVRIYDTTTNLPKGCGPKEAAISWNAQGQPGAPGKDGVSGYVTVYKVTETNSHPDKTEFVFCPAGTKVVGGGAGVYGPWSGDQQLIVDGVGLVADHPFNEEGWIARAQEFIPTDDDWYLFVKAICANVS
jgi:hypothetical protein